ncbi:unnamed protein product [Brassica rapa]|uniref:Uncharacterized protein n=1 Tax=Brassica campestris TaxID=3711 RepID=A0A3P5ZQQ0_BRACM|nr:unnamed protein product [Brassica rapa]VDC77834.1 unnamed protein product [Brassica rapa]
MKISSLKSWIVLFPKNMKSCPARRFCPYPLRCSDMLTLFFGIIHLLCRHCLELWSHGFFTH